MTNSKLKTFNLCSVIASHHFLFVIARSVATKQSQCGGQGIATHPAGARNDR